MFLKDSTLPLAHLTHHLLSPDSCRLLSLVFRPFFLRFTFDLPLSETFDHGMYDNLKIICEDGGEEGVSVEF